MGSGFDYPVKVRWSDVDRLGHINNTRYLTFTEDARLKWFSELPGRTAKGDTGGVILARTEIDYLKQVRFAVDGDLIVNTGVNRIGRSSINISQDILHTDRDRVAAVKMVLVRFDYVANSSVAWSDEQREWLESFQIGD